MKLIVALLVGATIIAVTGTAVALQLKPQTMEAVGRWISVLLANAIMGALGAVVLNFVGSLIVPEYWWPSVPGSWGMAGAGALGGVLAHCFTQSGRGTKKGAALQQGVIN
jgi:hypothetical protein